MNYVISSMKRFHCCICLMGLLAASARTQAQSYHSDSIVNGVHTLEVEGNLLLKQYAGGIGGDMNIIGDVHMSSGALVLPALPSGVSGVFYGVQKLGSSINVGEYVFEKMGDNTTGDFTVPLGRFGSWEGSTIQLDVLTGPSDSDSGAAHFTLMAKRHRANGALTAVEHSAFGGGRGIKLHGYNTHGVTHLYLEFDGTSNHNNINNHRAIVRASCIGVIDPMNRDSQFEHMTPVRLANSLMSDAIAGDEITHVFDAEVVRFNKKVVLSAPQGDISMGIYE